MTENTGTSLLLKTGKRKIVNSLLMLATDPNAFSSVKIQKLKTATCNRASRKSKAVATTLLTWEPNSYHDNLLKQKWGKRWDNLPSEITALPKNVKPRPRAKFRAFVSLASVSERSIIVWSMVDVTSPLHVPIATRPQAILAIPITYATKKTNCN